MHLQPLYPLQRPFQTFTPPPPEILKKVKLSPLKINLLPPLIFFFLRSLVNLPLKMYKKCLLIKKKKDQNKQAIRHEYQYHDLSRLEKAVIVQSLRKRFLTQMCAFYFLMHVRSLQIVQAMHLDGMEKLEQEEYVHTGCFLNLVNFKTLITLSFFAIFRI